MESSSVPCSTVVSVVDPSVALSVVNVDCASSCIVDAVCIGIEVLLTTVNNVEGIVVVVEVICGFCVVGLNLGGDDLKSESFTVRLGSSAKMNLVFRMSSCFALEPCKYRASLSW